MCTKPLILVMGILLLVSCSKNKISNVTEARHFLATHSWHDENAQFYDENGNATAKMPSGLEFTETDVTFNKETGAYNIESKPADASDFRSHNPYFLITWYDNYSTSMVEFYLMEDGGAWLENRRVKMNFSQNKGAEIQKVEEKPEAPTVEVKQNMLNKILIASIPSTKVAMIYREPNKSSQVEIYKRNGDKVVSSSIEKGEFIRVYYMNSNHFLGWALKSDFTIEREAIPSDTAKITSIETAETTENNGTEKTVVAKFEEIEIGDYFHIIFRGEDGKSYDFGLGKNNYCGYEFGEDKSNPEYVGKKFKITWKEQTTEYLDNISGEETKNNVPTIIKIEQIK